MMSLEHAQTRTTKITHLVDQLAGKLLSSRMVARVLGLEQTSLALCEHQRELWFCFRQDMDLSMFVTPDITQESIPSKRPCIDSQRLAMVPVFLDNLVFLRCIPP